MNKSETVATAKNNIDSAVLQQAANWMARLWSENVTSDDIAACNQWRQASPQHELVWQRLLGVEGKLNRLAANNVPGDMLLKKRRLLSRRKMLETLGIGAVTVTLAYHLPKTPLWQHTFADYSTATGEMSSLTLDDGTELTLNTDTAISVLYSEQQRCVVLHRGEVLINTAKDPAGRNFIVKTASGFVQALGTHFSVRQFEQHTQVAVYEGVVLMQPEKSTASQQLNAGEQGIFSLYGTEAVLTPLAETPAWTKGILIAEGMTLQNFAAEISRYRRGVVRVDPAIANLQISGVFSLRDTGRALDSLELALPVKVQYRTRLWVTVLPA